MKILELLYVALQSLTLNKIRSGLTMLGVIIGVAAVIAVVAIGKGAQQNIQAQISSLGSNVIIVMPGISMRGGVSGAAGSAGRMKEEFVQIIKERAKSVKAITPMVFSGGQVVYGSNNWSTSVQGVYPDYMEIRDWTISKGTFFGEQENRSGAKVCVIGNTIATNLFPNEDPIDQTIRIRNLPFKVIGVLKAKGQNAMGNDQDDIILAPFSTVQRKLRGIDFIHSILASAVSEKDIPVAQAEITDILYQLMPSAASLADPFTVRTQTEIAETANATSDTFTSLLFSIALVSLLVGGIGIMNIMLVSVTERTREIGIRRSIGARQSDIRIQFLIEAVFLSMLGGIIGIGTGVGAASIISRLQEWPTMVSADSIILALGVSATIGIFFGYYPANKAANLDVIEALRYE